MAVKLVPFVEISYVEFVFSLPDIFSFLPKIQADRPLSYGFKNNHCFPPFLALEDRNVVHNFVEVGNRESFFCFFSH